MTHHRSTLDSESSLNMLSSNQFRRLGQALLAVGIMAIGSVAAMPTASAAPYPVAWTGGGPGTTSVVSDGTGAAAPRFTYDMRDTDFVTRTWDFTTQAVADGQVTVPYEYTGFHSYYAASAFIRAVVVHDGVRTTTNLAGGSTYENFRFAGSTTLDVQTGDRYGFEFGGTNFDFIAQLSGTLLVGRTQAITFTQPDDVATGQTGVALDATSDSGLPVTFSSLTPTVCTVSGSAVQPLTAGTCTVAADQAGNDAYASAPQVSRSFSVTSVASSVEVSTDPAQLAADGQSTATVTATVRDGAGTPMPGQTVQLTADDPDVTLDAVTDKGDGTYTATLTASTTAHEVTVTATSGTLTGTASVTLNAVASSIAVSTDPAELDADGQSTATVTATVLDAAGDPLPGQTVQLTTDDPEVTLGTVTDEGDGTYTATLTASTTAHEVMVTATSGALTGTAALTLNAVVMTPPTQDPDPTVTTPPTTVAPSAEQTATEQVTEKPVRSTPVAVAQDASRLARTGFEPAPTLLAAAGLLVVGAAMLRSSRSTSTTRRH